MPIEAEIERRGIKLKRQGSELIGPCPRCGGTDRFSINVKENVWNCRQCKTAADTGDVIGFVQWIDKCDFITACTRLSNEPSPQRSNGKDQTEPRKVLRASYQYNDERGDIAFVVNRFGSDGGSRSCFFEPMACSSASLRISVSSVFLPSSR